MAGLHMATGLNGSVVSGLYGGYGSASVPPATGIPEGPATITQQAFGVPPADGTSAGIGVKAAGVSTLALAALVIIWWVLPR